MLERGARSLNSFLGRRNAASASTVFDRILYRHMGLHDLDEPRVKAEHDHALDTWQWVLELDAEAGLAVQVAALFHDVERLDAEASARVELRAPDYQTFKDNHALQSALVAARTLVGSGLSPLEVVHVTDLVAGHERPQARGEAALLADADVLSFFSSSIQGFLRCHGPAPTQLKIAWSLRRLHPRAAPMIERIRFDREVALLVAAELERPR
jgi:Domain of unknown function (DUF4202)